MERLTFYRVMLDSEDGVYCQKDGFRSEDEAESWCYRNDDYSEDRNLFIQPYSPMGEF